MLADYRLLTLPRIVADLIAGPEPTESSDHPFGDVCDDPLCQVCAIWPRPGESDDDWTLRIRAMYRAGRVYRRNVPAIASIDPAALRAAIAALAASPDPTEVVHEMAGALTEDRDDGLGCPRGVAAGMTIVGFVLGVLVVIGVCWP
jgi:hypothetical protein